MVLVLGACLEANAESPASPPVYAPITASEIYLGAPILSPAEQEVRAMAKSPLRSVGPDEKPPPKDEPKTVLEAAESGDRVAELVQIRRVIARALDNESTSPRDLAALSRRQMEISREIEALKRQRAEEVKQGAISGDEQWDEKAI